MTSINRVHVTRVGSGQLVRDQVFSALDFETTGLDSAGDQIVEIGLVKFTGAGDVLDEFSTLVRSFGSSASARQVHRIDDEDLIGAPQLKVALARVLALIKGSIVVAHNLNFEESFIDAAFAMCEMLPTSITGLCTLENSRRHLEGRAFSLKVMGKTATGEFASGEHTALGDARSVMQVLLWLERTAPTPLRLTQTVSTWSVNPSRPGDVDFRSWNRLWPDANCMAQILNSLPRSNGDCVPVSVEVATYVSILRRFCGLRSGRSREDAVELGRLAYKLRVSGPQLSTIHRDVWRELIGPQNADTNWHYLSADKVSEMREVADRLGLSDLVEKADVVSERFARVPTLENLTRPDQRFLSGIRIVSDTPGDSEIKAVLDYAKERGASIGVNVTRTVTWLVSSSAGGSSRMHRDAISLDIPVVEPDVAMALIDEKLRDSRAAFERELKEEREWEQWRRDLHAENDAFWRPSWREKELADDPGPSDYDDEF